MHETDTLASGEGVLIAQRHASGAAGVAPHYRAAYGPAVTIPPVSPLPPDSPVGPKARAALARVLALEEAEYQSLRERWQNLAGSPSLDTVIREMEQGPDKPGGPFYGLNNNGEPIDSALYAALMVSIRHLVRGLSFIDTGNKTRPQLQLADVPPILLHEAWADSHAIAAAGDGFDPHWEDKAGSQ